MNAEELDQRIREFEGKVVVQSAGEHTMPDGRKEPAMAVELNGKIGPWGLGKALGSVVRAYLAGNAAREEVAPAMEEAVVITIMRGMESGMNTAELVHIQQGKAI